MSGKDLMLDFLSLVFAIVLIGFAIFYFIVGNRIEQASMIMTMIAPFGLFASILLIRLRVLQRDYKDRKENNNTDIILYLGFMDKLKTEILVYLTPMLVLVLPIILGQGMQTIFFAQAVIVFLSMYLWHVYIFKKQR
jgi:hypothetical protein